MYYKWLKDFKGMLRAGRVEALEEWFRTQRIHNTSIVIDEAMAYDTDDEAFASGYYSN